MHAVQLLNRDSYHSVITSYIVDMYRCSFIITTTYLYRQLASQPHRYSYSNSTLILCILGYSYSYIDSQLAIIIMGTWVNVATCPAVQEQIRVCSQVIGGQGRASQLVSLESLFSQVATQLHFHYRDGTFIAAMQLDTSQLQANGLATGSYHAITETHRLMHYRLALQSPCYLILQAYNCKGTLINVTIINKKLTHLYSNVYIIL